MADDHDVPYQPEDTTIRWFAPAQFTSILAALKNDDRPFAWSSKHQEPTRLPVPVGATCSVCGVVFDEDGYGYTIPHRSMTATPNDRPYHLQCMWKMLGLERFLGENDE